MVWFKRRSDVYLAKFILKTCLFSSPPRFPYQRQQNGRTGRRSGGLHWICCSTVKLDWRNKHSLDVTPPPSRGSQHHQRLWRIDETLAIPWEWGWAAPRSRSRPGRCPRPTGRDTAQWRGQSKERQTGTPGRLQPVLVAMVLKPLDELGYTNTGVYLSPRTTVTIVLLSLSIQSTKFTTM